MADDFRKQFAPGVGLGHDERGGHAQVAQGGERLRAADHGGDTLKSGEHLGAGMASLNHAEELAGADAGQENGTIEFAGEEAGGPGEGGVIAFEGNLAHRGGDGGAAAITLDEGASFDGHPALEGDHAEAVEAWGRGGGRGGMGIGGGHWGDYR